MSDEEWPDGKAPSSNDLEAATWCVLLGDTPSDTTLAAFKVWFDASDMHVRDFVNAMRVTPMPAAERARVERFVGRSLASIEHERAQPLAAAPGATVQALRSGRGAYSPQAAGPARRRSGRRRWIRAIVAAAATIALVAGLRPDFLFQPFQSFVSPARAETFETGRGDIRRFTLADGSRVTLDTDSRVEVTIDRRRRHALLRKGRARFDVVADARSFTIAAGNGNVTASEGQIDVGMGLDRQVELRLRSGSARVSAHERASQTGRSDMPLTIDRPVLYAQGDFAPQFVAVPVADTRDWPSGWIEYRKVSLGELVRQANRYAKSPIVLDDALLADLSASGRFKLTETSRFADRIAELFALRVSRQSDGIHLSSRKPSSVN